MFSGIVEAIGLITNIFDLDGCRYFTIQVPEFHEFTLGESIAVNGVCLSVTAFEHDTFTVAAVPETLRLTNLGYLSSGSPINLERSLQASSRIGGHYVQGHVDAVGTVLELTRDNSAALLVKISIPKQLSQYIVAKGYIALDGMSITIIQANEDNFTATFIPLTQTLTITKHYTVGTFINIEVDILGKYVERILGAQKHASNN